MKRFDQLVAWLEDIELRHPILMSLGYFAILMSVSVGLTLVL